MAALEILALDEGTPQILAPQSGDTYLAPRAVNVVGGLTIDSAAVLRGVSNTLVLANSTNACGLQVFNTTNSATSPTNYERGFARWTSNIFEIGTEAGGTGTVRGMRLTPATIHVPNLPTSDPTVAGQLWNNSGVLTVSAG